jgi:DNA-binding IclR family transcriptional regulator
MKHRDSKPNEGKYSAPALEKGLDILEALANSEQPQGIADLSRILNRTPSEIFRMVSTLEKRGYIVRNDAGSFQLSLKLYELAHTHSPFEKVMKAASGPMRKLSDEVRETTVLAALSHGQLIVLAEELSTRRVRLSVEIGSPVPALLTVSGQLLVAHMATDERERFLAGDSEFHAMSAAKQKQVLAMLDEIREAGYCIASSNFRTGIDIAVPIGNPNIGLMASLAIPVLAGGENEGKDKRLLKAMMACTREINASLQLSPD